MKKIITTLCVISITLLSPLMLSTVNAKPIFSVPTKVNENSRGNITYVNYNKLDIVIDGISYKLSNTVKVYGYKGSKYLNVKKLSANLPIEFKYRQKGNKKIISDIWVQPL